MIKRKPKITPYKLKTEYLTNPVGIDVLRPRFSWLLKSEERGMMQCAYQVIVATSAQLIAQGIGDMWDSGKVASGETVNIEYAGAKLECRKRYWWRVCSYINAELQGSFSETAMFETALLEQSDFIKKWIGADVAIASPIFRREFYLEENIIQARAYICGLGYYEMYFNGQKAGNHVLDPNWTDYDSRVLQDLIYPYEDNSRKRALYVTYDITSLLKRGSNAVGIMLGNGWYNQTERNVEGKMTYGSPKFWLQIHIEYDDGNEVIFGSDSGWKYSKGPITFNNIYYGENYDARLEQVGWNVVGFDDSKWDMALEVPGVAGAMNAQMSPADKVISAITPVIVSSLKKGTQIFDLGRNISGWAQIKVTGCSGGKVVMRFAEELDADGGLDYISTGSEQQTQQDIYILNGRGLETYEPHFTWHGFRYIEVNMDAGVTMDSLLGIVVHTDVERAGSFSCSNDLFNKIFEIYGWSQLGNLHGGVPSDCPHRERLGYTGDGQITAESAILSFDMAAFYTKWINDIDCAQNLESGYIPHTVPYYGGGGGPGGWGCAAVLMPWYMFLYYGDKRILEKHYKMMLGWMEYMSRHTDEEGIVISEEPGSWCLGEWVVPHQFDKVPGKRDGFNIDVPTELVNTFFYSQSAFYMKKIAQILGDNEKESYFETLHDALKAAIHKKFYNEKTGSYAAGVQGCDVFPLAAGCVPDENKGRVLANLVSNIRERNSGHLDTGIFGTSYMLEVLADHGEAETAYTIMNQLDYPGYGYMISQGATTLWESWEKENGSHNHPMFGSVVGWMFKYVAGLRPDKDIPGFENIVIRPCLFSDIDYAEASYESVRGHIGIRWERQGTKIVILIDIPCNCSADVYLPVNELDKIVEDGVHIFHNGKLLDGLSGITGFSLMKDEVKVLVKSGRYCFEI
jgi:alpha-L-rhamnosidase